MALSAAIRKLSVTKPLHTAEGHNGHTIELWLSPARRFTICIMQGGYKLSVESISHAKGLALSDMTDQEFTEYVRRLS